MDCTGCRKALEIEPVKKRAEILDSVQAGTFSCETCAHPEGPGVVSDDEYLHFILFDPQQVFEDGSLRPTALMQVDFGGLSSLREGYSEAEFTLTISQMQAKNDGRKLYGVAIFKAAAVRTFEGSRLAGVYDTPLQGKVHHADIIAPVIGRDTEIGPRLSKGKREVLVKKRLKSLNQIIGEIVKPTDFPNALSAEAVL